ncbi:hypothetical protein QUA56_09730 [Microcoleus sp. N3A4]|uniref:hypothetical protein n=1 Tax=Microcoleus sp. N3A4 TaxID=3055379 RepID=UPI002FD05316
MAYKVFGVVASFCAILAASRFYGISIPIFNAAAVLRLPIIFISISLLFFIEWRNKTFNKIKSSRRSAGAF